MDQPLVNLHNQLLAQCRLLQRAKARKDVKYVYALITDIQHKVTQIEKRQAELDTMIQKINEANHGSIQDH